MVLRRPLVQVPGSGLLFTLEELRGSDNLDLFGRALYGWAGLYDVNGNVLFGALPITSAVNYWEVQNAATGQAPRLIANGTDTNVDAVIASRGSGRLKARYSGANYECLTDFLFAAKGDLVVATGSAAKAVVSVGTNGQGLIADSNATAGVAWKWRPVSIALHCLASSQSSWADMPAAETLLAGHHRHIQKFDATGFSQVRLVVNKQGTAGATGAKFIARYGSTFSTAASGYTADAGTSEVSVTIDVTDQYLESSWIDLAAGAKADVFFAIVGSGGNGTTDPQYGAIHLQFR